MKPRIVQFTGAGMSGIYVTTDNGRTYTAIDDYAEDGGFTYSLTRLAAEYGGHNGTILAEFQSLKAFHLLIGMDL